MQISKMMKCMEMYLCFDLRQRECEDYNNSDALRDYPGSSNTKGD